MQLRKTVLLLLTIVIGTTSFAQGKAPAYAAELPAFETFVKDWIRENNVPGLVVGFSKGDYTWVRAFGVADVENMTPMRIDSSFRLASVQKTMTAVAVLQLAEAGKLDLDADIRTYVPYYPQKPYTITARQLLSHLGGIPHYVNRDLEQHFKTHKSTREAIDVFANYELVAEPGTRYSYSSYGYNLLGAAIETASGMSYADYMQQHVWRPAGMTDTRMDDPTELIERRVRGYRLIDGQLRNSEFIDISSRFAAGGTRGTVVDLLRFIRALNGGVLLSDEMRTRMNTPARTRTGEAVPYALGWQIAPKFRAGIVVNDGGQQETRTNILSDPSNQFAWALAMNLEADTYGQVLQRLYLIVEGKTLALGE